jgi:3-dehydroquinate dehydratase II
MARTIHVLNGPNLNLLGSREPETYGRTTLADIEAACRDRAGALGFDLSFHQTNAEGTLIDQIQAARETAAGIVINPAGYTHTSIAIRDALAACACPVIEVHLSNVHAREPFRHRSYVSGVAAAVIACCGAQGYDFAIERLAALLRAEG